MLLKERVMDPAAKDEISEALAYQEYARDASNERIEPGWRVVPAYIFHWYPNKYCREGTKTLKDRTFGPFSKESPCLTRYYPTMPIKTVIDFEPAPPDLFYEDQKRQWCTELKIAYVPVYLHERLQTAAFKERVEAATRIAEQGFSTLLDQEALAVLGVEGRLADPQLIAAMDVAAMGLVARDERIHGRTVKGVAKRHLLRKYKTRVVDDLRRGLKSGRIVDPYARCRELADSAE